MADDAPWQPGDELSADRLNRHAEALRAATGIPGGTRADGFQTSAGVGYAPRRPQEFWIRLTGGGTAGVYAWVEQVPDDGGTWVDGERSGTTVEDPAVEVNGNAEIPLAETVRAFAWRLPGSNRLNFQMGTCG